VPSPESGAGAHGRPPDFMDTRTDHNGHMTTLGMLARELGVDERTLRRAITQGALRATRPSPRTLELTLSERQYIRRSWPLLAALRRTLRTEPNVRFAALFGSAATGADSPTSDVDLLITLRESGLEHVVDLSTKLGAILGRPVDVVRLEDAEADPSFLADALAEGRVVVDRDRVWPRLGERAARLRRRGRNEQAERAESALEGIDRLLAV